MDLEALRNKIDAIDREIIEKLNARIELASEIGRIKHQKGEPIYVPSREEEVFEKLARINKGPLDEKAIRAIYRQVISASIALEKELSVAYLGPEGTFTHQASLNNFGSSVAHIPMGTISDVFTSVSRGETDYGVIPIENSTEGVVHHSLDMLVETSLKIVAQVHLEISLCLISKSRKNDIKSVYSKDNALGQCRQWLGRMLPGAELKECDSTAKAVKMARDEEGIAAIASRAAAELYAVPILAEDIQDKKDNITRFLVIGNAPSARLGHGKDKTSFAFSVGDEVGALVRLLNPFSSRGINLCKIESRPSRQKPWEYYFFIDIIGHVEDPLVKEAIAELKQNCPMVNWLGSYPNSHLD